MTTELMSERAIPVRLGLRENAGQFALLVVINAFVGAMVGMERSLLPAIAEQDFGLAARTAILAFIVVFGIAKAVTNYGAGRWADRVGRKRILVIGWLIAAPVPFVLMWAPTWNWILFANALLGISQGLTWSTTVIMKIDLVGPRHRGFAMGLNEFSGYLAYSLSTVAAGWIAASYSLRPEPFALGVIFVAAGFLLSQLFVRDTHQHVAHEARSFENSDARAISARDLFWRTTIRDRNLSSVTQAGLVNNLNDGMAWGLFPILFASAGLPVSTIAMLAAVYTGTWSIVQLATGALSDRIGRKLLIVSGMWLQAVGIGTTVLSQTVTGFGWGAVFLGVGTAMVYPTLLAAIGDVAHPSWRAGAVGIYRLWRDLGYAIGALVAGITADAFGLHAAIWFIAVLTFASGVLSLLRMSETAPGIV
jgi:MFS family permease